jgi:hypothetical protein
MHVLRRFSLSRRTMLRGMLGGAAVTVGLPPLEAMLNTHGDALAGGEPLPRKFVMWMCANGFLLSRLEPEDTGTSWALTPQLQPLADVKPYVNVCTGFKTHGTDQTEIGHVEGLTAYNGYPLDATYYSVGGPTIDEVIAEHIDDTSPTYIRSLQVGISKPVYAGGGAPIYNAMSFRGVPGNIVPLPPITDPVEVWHTLFGLYPGPHAPKDNRALRQSMIDAVKIQADALRPKLGVLDTQRLDAHLQGVSELEHKITALLPACALPEEPTLHNTEPGGAEKITDVTNLMAQLIAYALQCDITRVASVMLLELSGDTSWGEIGLTTTQHTLSHESQYSASALEDYHACVVYQMERLGDFCNTLHTTVDPNGQNLLDSTIVYASSDLSVGWLHRTDRMPVILIGSGGGHLKSPGVHVQATPNSASDPDGVNAVGVGLPTSGNTSDILLACLQGYDASADEIGAGIARSTDPLTDILA